MCARLSVPAGVYLGGGGGGGEEGRPGSLEAIVLRVSQNYFLGGFHLNPYLEGNVTDSTFLHPAGLDSRNMLVKRSLTTNILTYVGWIPTKKINKNRLKTIKRRKKKKKKKRRRNPVTGPSWDRKTLPDVLGT